MRSSCASTVRNSLLRRSASLRDASARERLDSIEVDRTKVKNLNVPLSDVFDTLQIYLGSAYVNDITLFGLRCSRYVT